MSWLIMNDEIDYSCMWYPTHMINKDNKLVQVFIGASQTLLKGLVGLYIKDEDYDQIRHDKAYIFLHDPEAVDDDIDDIEWDTIDDVTDSKKTGRVHIHLWKDLEFEGTA